ncbi:MAG: radical SAM protein [Clostridia bacterium]|nr:radical SAM protein [Clostridia bacterium]
MSTNCDQCPRACGADRERTVGYCGVPWEFHVARAALHPWEEPQISGTRGSGTVFFCGCNLRCVYCQNRAVSRAELGRRLDAEQLLDVMLRLEAAGAHNINLVTPTQYAQQLVPVLERAKQCLHIPIVYNCGGYEGVDALRCLEGLVDIYLPDFKYVSTELSARYSGAQDYCEVATRALAEMLRQTGAPIIGADGIMTRGVIVRHLVLPSARKDSVAVLRHLAERFGTDAFLLSLMSQYTPAFAVDTPYRELHRRVTTFEYESVANEAIGLGFSGNLQARTSANAEYTPDFREESFLP